MSVFYTNSKALEWRVEHSQRTICTTVESCNSSKPINILKFTCALWPCLSVGPPEDDGHLHTVPLESKEVAHGHSFELWWQNHLHLTRTISSVLSSSPCFQVEHGPIKKKENEILAQNSLSSALYLFSILVKVLLARFECWGISQPPLNRDERKHRRQREEVTNCATDAVQYWTVLQELHGRFFLLSKIIIWAF